MAFMLEEARQTKHCIRSRCVVDDRCGGPAGGASLVKVGWWSVTALLWLAIWDAEGNRQLLAWRHWSLAGPPTLPVRHLPRASQINSMKGT
jgi:hypothetical protein